MNIKIYFFTVTFFMQYNTDVFYQSHYTFLSFDICNFHFVLFARSALFGVY